MAFSSAPNQFPVNGYNHSTNRFDEYSFLLTPTYHNVHNPTTSQHSGNLEGPPSPQESLLNTPGSQSSNNEIGSASLPIPSNGGGGGGENSPTGMMWYLELPRVFYPFTLCYLRPPTPQALTTYNPTTSLTHPVFNIPDKPSTRPHTDSQTIVVSCRALQAASLGIFFGQNSKYNFSLLVGDSPPHNRSNLAAEIFAAHKALKLSRNIANVLGPDRTAIMKVIVVTSCASVFKVITEWIEELNEKDWDGADKYFEGAMGTRSAFERLDRLIEEMVGEDGLEVVFWHVRPEGVVEAERLARDKLAEVR